MSDHGGMWIPRWAWRLWTGTGPKSRWVPTGEPPPPDGPHRFSEQHARLLTQLQSEASADWSRTALIACLEQLRTSNVTEAGQIVVLDAWVDGSDAFCVVYQSPYEAGEVGNDVVSAESPDPVAFGWNVADFDIGEPGPPGPLRHDQDNGTSWWGSLGDSLPRNTSP